MKTLEASRYKQRGFTIIELVIVILVIGILSAVALPRMIDLSGQARKSVVTAVAGNFSTALELLRAQWIAESKQDTVTNMDGKTFYIGAASTNGYVTTAAATEVAQGAATATNCLTLWTDLLKSPPLASTTANCNTDGSCKFLVTVTTDAVGGDICTYTDRDSNLISYNRKTGAILAQDSTGKDLININ